MFTGIVSVRTSFFKHIINFRKFITSILKLRKSIIFGFLQGPEIDKYSKGAPIHETKHRH